MRTSKAVWTLLAACFLLFPLGASAGTADWEKYWTNVGSVGTLDEKSEGKVFYDHARVQKGEVIGFKSARQPRTNGGGAEETDSAVIRYNVTAVDGLLGVQGIAMSIRFRAEGVGARVVAQLIEVDMASGAQATLLTFDSDNAWVQSGYHLAAVCDDGRAQIFNFVEKIYYIEATLTTSAIDPSSAAGIEAIQLSATPCP